MNLSAVRERIASAGGGAHVTVVAVTKGFGPAAVVAAEAAGCVDLGENYAAELEVKAQALDHLPAAGRRWHFLGTVQRNKVRRLAGRVHRWHGVDRLAAGHEIARWAPGAEVFVQVNVSGEPTKSGCTPAEAPALVDALRQVDLEVRGLMAVGPQGPPEAARPAFRSLASLGRSLELDELSMGMSDDLEVAVQEGATVVRVGRALFGPRPQRA